MAKAYEHFDRAVKTYNQAADLQAQVARNLARYLPDFDYPRVLEIGTGTGGMTQEIARAYGNEASYVLTDRGAEPLPCLRSSFKSAASYVRMDGDCPAFKPESFDLIVSSMTLQWLKNPNDALSEWQKLLSKDGMILYSTIGRNNFHEWRKHLQHRHLQCAMRNDLPDVYHGQFEEESIPYDYNNGRGFLKMLKLTGANSPRDDYQTRHHRAFLHACNDFDGKVEWHIVYGLLHARHVHAPHT